MSNVKEDNWLDFPQIASAKPIWRTARNNKPHIVFDAMEDGVLWEVRLNDFPDEPAYSLLVNGVVIIHFNDWPVSWGQRPQFPN